MDSLDNYKKEIDELRQLLTSHQLFSTSLNVNQIRQFMESHIFSVWGFMSLLKSLQSGITVNDVPWMPNENTKNGLTNFINEIVLCEESDEIDGIGYISHFEIYLLAMSEIRASTLQIDLLIEKLNREKYSEKLINELHIHDEVKDFIKYDLEIALSGNLPKIVGSFTLGREKVIPKIFSYIEPCIEYNDSTKNLLTYLKRHINIDGDRHGPLSIELLNKICESNEDYSLAYKSGIMSLKLRLKVWDRLASELGIA
tara:strand:+ start:2665 stop:3432 length:768 start_codon:yes stop_codon:yes gene_type:complete